LERRRLEKQQHIDVGSPVRGQQERLTGPNADGVLTLLQAGIVRYLR
jgi:hypothetical protein